MDDKEKLCGVCFGILNCLQTLHPRILFGIVQYCCFVGEGVNSGIKPSYGLSWFYGIIVSPTRSGDTMDSSLLSSSSASAEISC